MKWSPLSWSARQLSPWRSPLLYTGVRRLNGQFNQNIAFRFAAISDGLSNTAGIGERYRYRNDAGSGNSFDVGERADVVLPAGLIAHAPALSGTQ